MWSVDLLLAVPVCCVAICIMGIQSPAKICRAVKRMTKFIERKRPVLTTVILPFIDIPPVFPKLSITHVQTINVLPQPQLKPCLAFSKPILTSFIPEDYQHDVANDDEFGSRPLSHLDLIKFIQNQSINRSQELNKRCPSSVLPTWTQLYEAQVQVGFRVPTKNYPYYCGWLVHT